MFPLRPRVISTDMKANFNYFFDHVPTRAERGVTVRVSEAEWNRIMAQAKAQQSQPTKDTTTKTF